MGIVDVGLALSRRAPQHYLRFFRPAVFIDGLHLSLDERHQSFAEQLQPLAYTISIGLSHPSPPIRSQTCPFEPQPYKEPPAPACLSRARR